jgi:hypothetical protein
MRAAIPLLLAAATAHASPDPCTAKALHLTKVTEVAPAVVGRGCQIRTDDGAIDTRRLHKTFPSVTALDAGYASTKLTLPVTSAKQLAAAVTCDGDLPTIDFTKNRAWVIARLVPPNSSIDIPRGFDDGKTWLLAERTHGGCPGGARYAAEPRLVTTIVVVPVDREIERRACFIPPASPCARNPK